MNTSLSGKTVIDWEAFACALDPVETISETSTVKRRSRDFFWYSPILNAQLKRSFGDLVALPQSIDEIAQCLRVAHAFDAPITIRGGGTGNYGQAVPMDGGLILDMTAFSDILDIGDGFVTVQAGANIKEVNEALNAKGWELAIFPSTQDIATIGGFVGGGSSGIGSVANGMLRDPGNILSLRAMSVTAAPEEHLFEGDAINHMHHAWGLNGVITEVTLRTVPHRDWIGCMATFDSYEECFSAGYALAQSAEVGRKLVSTVDARICAYFPKLEGHIRPEKHLMVSLVPREDLDAYRSLVAMQSGSVDLAMSEAELAAAKLPHVFEFSYNHTTLQVLKADRSATYLQVGVPTPPDPAKVAALAPKLGDDVWMHHEFALLNKEIVSFDLPIIWFTDEPRLREIEAIYEKDGFAVYDAHICMVEGGGLKNADYRHLAWKKRMDPKGLLNSAKSREWKNVAHLSPEQIEELIPEDADV
ncbi:FAD/FMN-containing dehydrogenase [Shimia isoporae]|uniref:FAD/FMN-containing dehydrogenase n=1 Tax=Shimia isoporae TaxID=647720 RepID=A0A4R1NA66_9RHOB|nr:FAD-binding oxidoreductase [Shimia isoporae]TCL00712.1 FAD/FMN-containing dehydrogenase [Shimia isoporae]